jgi:hypothetical protein
VVDRIRIEVLRVPKGLVRVPARGRFAKFELKPYKDYVHDVFCVGEVVEENPSGCNL